jgi:hypothetical protein
MPQPAPDPLEDLRERLHATREAAERLAGQAVPPQGWATPDGGRAAAQELQALVAVLGQLRELLPPEIWEQVRELARQVLLVVRALFDHLVERLDAERAPAARPSAAVEEIPIA